MILTALMLAVLGAPGAGSEPRPGDGHGPASDTITMGAVWDVLHRHYGSEGLQRELFLASRGQRVLECRIDRDPMCFTGGDPDHRVCYPGTVCDWDPGPVIEELARAAWTYPEAGFVNGQAVYALVKHGRPEEAEVLARRCRAELWWCELLLGYSLHALGRLGEAEERFRVGLETAPPEISCEAHDASRLLGTWMWVGRIPGSTEWGSLQRLSCDERVVVSRRLWWLSDPLYTLEGNDRWAEHAARAVSFELHTDLLGHLRRRVYRHGYVENPRRSFRVRRGVARSWRFLAGIHYPITTEAEARYHFVPDFEDGDLERPSWRLLATEGDEGYTPPYGTFHELPTQIARFRSPDTRGDSTRVAAAATVVGTELVAARDPQPHLILTDAPESFPVHVTGAFDEHRTSTFLVTSAAERHVLSYEVLSDGRFGWHRQMLEPLEGTGAGISDVLLYRPDDPAPPEALEPAAALMLGEPAVAQGAELGVFWEAYGAPAGREVTVELEIEGGRGGLFSRLRSLLPGGGSTPVRLSWSEPSPGEVFPRGVSLGTEGLEPGSYTLVVRIAWEGQDALESTRSVEVR